MTQNPNSLAPQNLLPANPPDGDRTAPLDPLSHDAFLNRMLCPSALETAARHNLPWVWHGFLAPGMVTLLTSQWKSGKTTLVSILLKRLEKGGQLAGLPVTPARAVVVSEESPENWLLRSQKLNLGDHVSFLCRPFRGKPSPEEWIALLDSLAQLKSRRGLDLVVIDTLASFLPGRNENTAGVMVESLIPLQRLAALDVAVLLVHHPYKGATIAGQAARGSGALSASVDILMEMSWFRAANDGDRRRRLFSYSRHDETPRQLVIELSADGSDYLVHSSAQEEEFFAGWKVLQTVLEDATRKLTRRKILEQWPPDFPAPDEVALWRWLERAVAQGLVRQEGRGRRRDPFLYFLPGQESGFRPSPAASKEEWQSWNNRVLQGFVDNLAPEPSLDSRQTPVE